ncbi:MAG: hypothetical protein MHM6MM_006872 [Cercozoa sp. M6MM]
MERQLQKLREQLSQHDASLLDQLKEFDALHAFSYPQREKLCKRISAVMFQQDDVVFEQGDAGTSIYLIIQGVFEVTQTDSDGNLSSLAMLHAGESFGELAGMEMSANNEDTGHRPSITGIRSSTVVARVESICLKVPWKSLAAVKRSEELQTGEASKKIALLERIGLFKHFAKKKLTQLSLCMHKLSMQAGDLVDAEGMRPSLYVYVLERGTVTISGSELVTASVAAKRKLTHRKKRVSLLELTAPALCTNYSMLKPLVATDTQKSGIQLESFDPDLHSSADEQTRVLEQRCYSDCVLYRISKSDFLRMVTGVSRRNVLAQMDKWRRFAYLRLLNATAREKSQMRYSSQLSRQVPAMTSLREGVNQPRPMPENATVRRMVLGERLAFFDQKAQQQAIDVAKKAVRDRNWLSLKENSRQSPQVSPRRIRLQVGDKFMPVGEVVPVRPTTQQHVSSPKPSAKLSASYEAALHDDKLSQVFADFKRCRETNARTHEIDMRRNVSSCSATNFLDNVALFYGAPSTSTAKSTNDDDQDTIALSKVVDTASESQLQSDSPVRIGEATVVESSVTDH